MISSGNVCEKTNVAAGCVLRVVEVVVERSLVVVLEVALADGRLEGAESPVVACVVAGRLSVSAVVTVPPDPIVLDAAVVCESVCEIGGSIVEERGEFASPQDVRDITNAAANHMAMALFVNWIPSFLISTRNLYGLIIPHLFPAVYRADSISPAKEQFV